MKAFYISFSSVFVIAVLLIACGRPEAVNTMEEMNQSVEGVPLPGPSLIDSNLYGTYRGVLPCADCEGVQYKLSLSSDDQFELKEYHADHSCEECTHRGNFNFDKERKRLRLPLDGKQMRFQFKDEFLFLLDEGGEPVVGEISESTFLSKSPLNFISAIWSLDSIAGNMVADSLQKRTHLRFLPDNNFTYTGGCNECRGNYQSMIDGEIGLRSGACTKVACPPNSHLDDQMNRYLRGSKRYQIRGQHLIFFEGDQKVLVFETPF